MFSSRFLLELIGKGLLRRGVPIRNYPLRDEYGSSWWGKGWVEAVLLTWETYSSRCQWSTSDHVRHVASFLQQDLVVILPPPLPASQHAKALLLPREGTPEVPYPVVLGISPASVEALSYSHLVHAIA